MKMVYNKYHFCKIALITILFFIVNFTYSQDSLPNATIIKSENNNLLKFLFTKPLVEFSKGELVSNVLVVYNNKNTSVTFYIDLSVPSNWNVLLKKNQLYTLAPGDSVFIPIHILPKVNLKGSSRYLFSVYLNNEKNEPLGFTYFYGEIKKNISWQLTASNNKIYLRNNQTNVPFSLSLFNSGTDEQDIHLSMLSFSKSYSVLDSSGQNIAKLPVTFNVKPQKDTSIYYTFNKHSEPRNYRLIDVEGYNPYSLGEEKKYTLITNSSSPNPSDFDKFRANQKIEFLQLSDLWTVNQYGTDVIPLMVDLNAFNILGSNPMMNLNLYGQTMINEKNTIIYNSQLSYYSNFFTTNPYENAMLYLGYFNSKYNIQFGNILGGIMGTFQNGQGIKAEYIISNDQKINAFYTRSPNLFSNTSNYSTAGINHNYQNKIIRINSQFGHSVANILHKYTDVLNVNISTNFIKNHSFGIRAGVSRNVKQDSVVVNYGFLGGMFYNGRFFNNKLNSSINGMFNTASYGFINYERFTANAGNDFKLNKKWNIYLKNSLYRYPDVDSNIKKVNYMLNNQLNFTNQNSHFGNLSPYLFYNISRIQDFRVHSRGVGLNVGKYNLNENYRYFVNLMSGYNKSPDTLKKDYFFLQFAGLIQIKTLSFSTRYLLGNYSVTEKYYVYNNSKNPQSISLSLRHQYVFKRTAFVMQNAVGYTYSTISGRNINFNPEIFCYTKRGWRYRVFSEINFSIGTKSDVKEIYYPTTGGTQDVSPQWSKGFYLGVGIRKEFGIPIPKTKSKYCTIKFITFYDINGNGKREKNEDLIEDVVIKTDSWEIITNSSGEATLENVPKGMYLFNAFSLSDLKGWFPHINDTVVFDKSQEFYLPFVRGVKVTGKVFIDKDKMSADADAQIDLSRIKISAINARTFTCLTNFDGTFEFYIPLGDYILSMDEKVLGEKYMLLQNNFELKIDDKFDNLFIPFYVVEKRRKVKIVKFDNNGNIIND